MYGNYSNYEEVPKRKRGDDPPISIYLINEVAPEMSKFSCVWCKRTVVDVKGRIDKMIDAPVDVGDFGIAVNSRCKLCHQNYRFIATQTFIEIVTQVVL
jgi:hypothetical protein